MSYCYISGFERLSKKRIKIGFCYVPFEVNQFLVPKEFTKRDLWIDSTDLHCLKSS